jgi:hypothetical protein
MERRIEVGHVSTLILATLSGKAPLGGLLFCSDFRPGDLMDPPVLGLAPRLCGAVWRIFFLHTALNLLALASPFRRQYFLNTDLVNQMISSQVLQVRSFLLIRQVRPDAVDHHQD